MKNFLKENKYKKIIIIQNNFLKKMLPFDQKTDMYRPY